METVAQYFGCWYIKSGATTPDACCGRDSGGASERGLMPSGANPRLIWLIRFPARGFENAHLQGSLGRVGASWSEKHGLIGDKGIPTVVYWRPMRAVPVRVLDQEPSRNGGQPLSQLGFGLSRQPSRFAWSNKADSRAPNWSRCRRIQIRGASILLGAVL